VEMTQERATWAKIGKQGKEPILEADGIGDIGFKGNQNVGERENQEVRGRLVGSEARKEATDKGGHKAS
jgi:hypothetical protein